MNIKNIKEKSIVKRNVTSEEYEVIIIERIYHLKQKETGFVGKYSEYSFTSNFHEYIEPKYFDLRFLQSHEATNAMNDLIEGKIKFVLEFLPKSKYGFGLMVRCTDRDKIKKILGDRYCEVKK